MGKRERDGDDRLKRYLEELASNVLDYLLEQRLVDLGVLVLQFGPQLDGGLVLDSNDSFDFGSVEVGLSCLLEEVSALALGHFLDLVEEALVGRGLG